MLEINHPMELEVLGLKTWLVGPEVSGKQMNNDSGALDTSIRPIAALWLL